MKKTTLCILALLFVLFAACVREYTPAESAYEEPPAQYDATLGDDQCPREQLIAMGWSEESLDLLENDGISLERMLNQARFIDYAGKIYDGEPIGPSGEIILPEYRGDIYFNDYGILTVIVLDGAFNHAGSATAIEEMREIGIIISRGEFAQQELTAAIDVLNMNHEQAAAAGSNSWGLGATNRVTVQLDPYTDEQKAIFTNFLRDISLNPVMFILEPAVTQDMLDHRASSVANAIASPGDQIVLVGDVSTSRTGIAFSLENRTTQSFNYGSPWDLAYYSNGTWLPVPHLPGAGGGFWTSEGYWLQSGGIQQYHQNFSWHFGELTPGRYMFMRGGWLGENWSPDSVYALVEFVITANCPVQLPPPPPIDWYQSFIELVEYGDVTPTGMRVVVENVSSYDITSHRAQIIAVVPERYTRTGPYWEWSHLGVPFINNDWFDYAMQGEGDIPIGGQLEFTLDWSKIFGELEPGDYKIVLSLVGMVGPPHPTGWIGGSLTIAFTI